MNNKPDCAYCEFLNPGHRCYECYKVKPKPVRALDRSSRWFRAFVIVAITVAVFWLDRIHSLLVRIADKPPVTIYYQLDTPQEEYNYELKSPKYTQADWASSRAPRPVEGRRTYSF